MFPGNRRNFRYRVILLLVLFSGPAVPVLGHATKYEILPCGTVGIRASYEDGTAIGNADVLVFAPGEKEFSRKLRTGTDGVFHFDPDRPGTWALQVRDPSGHGMRINLNIDDSLRLEQDEHASGPDSLQKTLMAACALWGFLGTALFFSRKRRT